METEEMEGKEKATRQFPAYLRGMETKKYGYRTLQDKTRFPAYLRGMETAGFRWDSRMNGTVPSLPKRNGNH